MLYHLSDIVCCSHAPTDKSSREPETRQPSVWTFMDDMTIKSAAWPEKMDSKVTRACHGKGQNAVQTEEVKQSSSATGESEQ